MVIGSVKAVARGIKSGVEGLRKDGMQQEWNSPVTSDWAAVSCWIAEEERLENYQKEKILKA